MLKLYKVVGHEWGRLSSMNEKTATDRQEWGISLFKSLGAEYNAEPSNY